MGAATLKNFRPDRILAGILRAGANLRGALGLPFRRWLDIVGEGTIHNFG